MPQITKYIIGIAITAVVFFLMWYFSNVVAYVLISAVLAIVGNPVVQMLTKIKIGKFSVPNSVAALLTLLLIWSIALVVFVVFIPLIFKNVNQLASIDVTKIIEMFQEPITGVQTFLNDNFHLKVNTSSIAETVSKQVGKILNLDVLNNFVSSIIGTISGLFISLFSISFITFFFLREDGLFLNMVSAILPSKYEGNVSRAMESITNLLKRYFRGILAESTIVMIVLSLSLIIFGIKPDTAFFIGLMVGILNVIPYIGPLIGAGIGVFMGLMNPIEGVTLVHTSIVIIGSTLFTQGVDNFILQPVLYSNQVKAHPLEIFLVILIAGSMAGVLGMLLAIPSYTVLRVLGKEFFNHFRLVQKLTDSI